MTEVDAVVLGAGPAGTTVALNLAPFRRVLVLERRSRPAARIGESLPGAARRLLTDMGLWEGFLSDGHLPCFARRSAWGGAEPVEADSTRDPDGHGWHLDRARFEARLRATAVARGAVLLSPVRVGGVERRGAGWRVAWSRGGQREEEARARVVIEARGRASRPPAAFGTVRLVADRLVCGWVAGREGTGGVRGVTHTEAEPEGWWYTAPLPGGRRVLALHTDSDLPAATDACQSPALVARALRHVGLAPVLRHAAFDMAARPGFCAAHGCRLARPAGEGWFAVGDACLALDPLSSQGLLNALYTGLAAAEAADRFLSGDHVAGEQYGHSVRAIWDCYRRNLEAWYSLERRWRDKPFWRRRAGPV